MAFDVVIAGGGFGGLYAARRLETALARHTARITLVTDRNYMLYTPLLPGAAAGSLEPRHVVVPVREELGWSDVKLGSVTGGDPAAHTLSVRTVDGRDETLGYDHLVLALGSVSRTLPVPGLAEHGVGFNDLADAVELRNHALWNLEVAESMPDPESRRPYLTFVFVGAGYAGVEGIAELQDFVNTVIDRYPRCRIDGTRWILVEAEGRIMQEIPESLAEFATRQLRGRGLEVHTNTRLDSLTEDAATLSSGEVVPTRLLCWTAGVKPPSVVAELGLPVNHAGRIITDKYMRVEGFPGVWAIGDAAAVPDPAKGRKGPCPPTAQHALRHGRRAADNVASTLKGGKLKPFRYRTLGVFVDMGQHLAVATMLGVRLRGLPAWFAARTYHLMLMPGVARRFRLAADWTVGLLFGRASAELGQLGHPAPLGEGERRPEA
jgi:NADH:ubiquinone reductase (H+-translocating)